MALAVRLLLTVTPETPIISTAFPERPENIDFRDAVEALEDPHRLEEPDLYEDEERTRVLCLYEPRMAVLFVVTAEPEDGVCRIISARRAERHEQERYWKNRSLQP